MKIERVLSILILLAAAFVINSCQSNKETSPTAVNNNDNQNSLDKKKSITVFATGLNNPRGLKFGPDGNLYVAEGGLGGYISSVGLCDDSVPGPIGPYLGGHSARVVKINWQGNVSVVADSLPSDQTATGARSGVADVAFIGDKLYALLAAGGCTHGHTDVPNGVIKINQNGSWNVVADLSAYLRSHPAAQADSEDYEPDGTWYSMISVRGELYAINPNGGQMVRITTDGTIQTVVDFSAFYGHIVPTALAYHGNFFAGNLNVFPIVPGSSNIYKVTPSGQPSIWASGFSTILGLVIDHRDRMYVLENTTVAGRPTPGTGKVIRVSPNGSKTVIADSLFLPTGMTLGPDGALYVSNKGFGPPVPGFGEILRIDIRKFNHHGHHGRNDGDNDEDDE